VQRLLTDLRGLPHGDKAVVFSSLRAGVEHLQAVLTREGIDHVAILKGDGQPSLRAAVRRWKEQAECSIFLLHADAAAAGLTLNEAAHVFLMEPFEDQKQEFQALARCHRMGQEKVVHAKRYFSPGTIEERILAYRRLEDDPDEAEAVSTVALSAVLANKRASADAPRQLARRQFLCGMQPTAARADDDGSDDDDGNTDAGDE